MNKAIDKRTASISANAQIEWKVFFDFDKDGNIRSTQETVHLFEPSTKDRIRDTIATLRPQTALNLLAWLEQEREKLEALASKQE